MPPRMLLKSWAMPPASSPMDSIFWAWMNRSSRSLRSEMSRTYSITPVSLPSSIEKRKGVQLQPAALAVAADQRHDVHLAECAPAAPGW